MARQTALRKQATELIDQLPSEKLRELVDYLSYLVDKKSWEATWELTRDPHMMADIRAGLEALGAGKRKPWRQVRRDV